MIVMVRLVCILRTGALKSENLYFRYVWLYFIKHVTSLEAILTLDNQVIAFVNVCRI
jgi:hypothetical protein